MSRTLAFPVPSGVIEALDFMLSERRKADPATPSRDAFLAELVEDTVTAELRRLKERARPPSAVRSQ